MDSLPGTAGAPPAEDPDKPTGFSKKFVLALGGVLVIMVFAVLVAFHKKAQQQANPKPKTTAQGALSTVIAGVSAGNGSSEAPPASVVPTFVQNMSMARPVDTTQKSPAQPALDKIVEKNRNTAIDSSLKMVVQDDYDPFKKAEEAKAAARTAQPSTADIMKAVLASQGQAGGSGAGGLADYQKMADDIRKNAEAQTAAAQAAAQARRAPDEPT